MSNPIDIIAAEIRTADGNHTLGAGHLAEVAAGALTDDRIVDNAVQALKFHGWDKDATVKTTLGEHRMDDDDLRNIVRTVLGSVGDAS